jgi:hypothetical protein
MHCATAPFSECRGALISEISCWTRESVSAWDALMNQITNRQAKNKYGHRPWNALRKSAHLQTLGVDSEYRFSFCSCRHLLTEMPVRGRIAQLKPTIGVCFTLRCQRAPFFYANARSMEARSFAIDSAMGSSVIFSRLHPGGEILPFCMSQNSTTQSWHPKFPTVSSASADQALASPTCRPSSSKKASNLFASFHVPFLEMAVQPETCFHASLAEHRMNRKNFCRSKRADSCR